MVVPSEGDGVAFLKELRRLLFSYTKRGYRFVIVIGGGAPARMYQERLRAVGVTDPNELDWVGIYAIQANAKFVSHVLAPQAEHTIITDPKQRFSSRKPIILAGGHKPGASTDFMAVRLAHRFGAEYVVNVSNVEYVYSADPRKVPNATRFLTLDWQEMQKIVGTKWSPGMHTPFDPIATAFARKHKLSVAMLGGNRIGELAKLIDAKPFHGTWIRPKA